MAEEPAAGKAGEDEGVHCPQKGSLPNDESAKAYVLEAVPHAPSTEALQEEVEASQPKPELQSQVQSPAVAERAQLPETDCEEAVECAFVSAIVPPQTSAIQESEGPSAYPGRHETDTSEAEGVPIEHEAFPVFVPMERPVPERTPFVTEAEAPWESAGTAYPFKVPEAQPVGVPDFAPSTSGSEGVPAGSRTSPSTEPEIHTGNVPETATVPPAGGMATTWIQDSVRSFPPDFRTKSTAPTARSAASYAEEADPDGTPVGNRTLPENRTPLENEVRNFSGSSFSLA